MPCKNKKHIKILIIDDDPFFLDGIKEYFRKRCIARDFVISNNSLEAKDLALNDDFDIIITDIKMQPLNGIEFCDIVKLYKPNQRIIVLTQFTSREYILPLLKLGVSAIVDKVNAKIDLLQALKSVLDGKKFYSQKIQQLMEMYYSGQKKRKVADEVIPILTNREKLLLPYIARGLSNKQIVKILQNLPEKIYLSEHTIETHRHNLYLKFNVKNAAQLAYKAKLYGLLS